MRLHTGRRVRRPAALRGHVRPQHLRRLPRLLARARRAGGRRLLQRRAAAAGLPRHPRLQPRGGAAGALPGAELRRLAGPRVVSRLRGKLEPRTAHLRRHAATGSPARDAPQRRRHQPHRRAQPALPAPRGAVPRVDNVAATVAGAGSSDGC
ncbi:unnamed protein product, partial [Phaeothamnion confervicola]